MIVFASLNPIESAKPRKRRIKCERDEVATCCKSDAKSGDTDQEVVRSNCNVCKQKEEASKVKKCAKQRAANGSGDDDESQSRDKGMKVSERRELLILSCYCWRF